MNSKVHLRQGKDGTTACASRGVDGRGKVLRNSRRTYQFMASKVVGPNEFVATPASARCAHCCDRFVPMMVARHKRLGLPPFTGSLVA